MSEEINRGPSRGFSLGDRQDIFIWAFIGFVPSVFVELMIQHGTYANASNWTLARELPARGVAALSLIVATFVVSARQKRPLSDYAIPLNQAFGWRFWLGAIVGFAMLTALLLVQQILRAFSVQSVALSGNALFYYAIGWGLVFLFVSLAEELAFRSYALFVGASRLGFWRAALALSLGFAVAHLPNKGETVIGILHTFGTGLLFCFFVRRTGSLWFAIGYHAAWDWAESFFYGTPDSGLLAEGHWLNTAAHGSAWLSGGSAGPEGSVLSIAILVLAALLVHVMFPTARYPVGAAAAPLPS